MMSESGDEDDVLDEEFLSSVAGNCRMTLSKLLLEHYRAMATNGTLPEHIYKAFKKVKNDTSCQFEDVANEVLVSGSYLQVERAFEILRKGLIKDEADHRMIQAPPWQPAITTPPPIPLNSKVIVIKPPSAPQKPQPLPPQDPSATFPQRLPNVVPPLVENTESTGAKEPLPAGNTIKKLASANTPATEPTPLPPAALTPPVPSPTAAAQVTRNEAEKTSTILTENQETPSFSRDSIPTVGHTVKTIANDGSSLSTQLETPINTLRGRTNVENTACNSASNANEIIIKERDSKQPNKGAEGNPQEKESQADSHNTENFEDARDSQVSNQAQQNPDDSKRIILVRRYVYHYAERNESFKTLCSKKHWRILVDVKKQKMTNESKIALYWMEKIELLIGDEMGSVVSTKTIQKIEKRFADWENELDYVQIAIPYSIKDIADSHFLKTLDDVIEESNTINLPIHILSVNKYAIDFVVEKEKHRDSIISIRKMLRNLVLEYNINELHALGSSNVDSFQMLAPPIGTNTSQPATLIHVYAVDITRAIVDAIAISTSQALSSPIDKEGHLIKGVAKSVLVAGGDEIQHEVKRIMETRKNDPITPGQVVITPAGGKLPSLFVLHGTVGPKSTAQENILQLLYKNILLQACELKIDTIALPLIGVGHSHKNVSKCCELLLTVLEELRLKIVKKIKAIHIVDINQINANTIAQALRKQSEKSKFLQRANVLPSSNILLSLMIFCNKNQTHVDNPLSKNVSNKPGPLKPATQLESIHLQLATNVVILLEGTDPFRSAIPTANFDMSYINEDTEQKPHANEAFNQGGRS